MTRVEAGRLGGKALVEKYGVEHMRRIGSKGFFAAMCAIAERQGLESYSNSGVNPFRSLLANLTKRKRRF